MLSEDEFAYCFAVQPTIEVWEAGEICVLDDEDEGGDDPMDEELDVLAHGWLPVELPPMHRFDHEQDQLTQRYADHHVQHNRDLGKMDEWVEGGFNEHLNPMECDVQEFLTHPDSDIPFWYEWLDSIHPICSLEEHWEWEDIPPDRRGAVTAGTWDPLRALNTPPDVLHLAHVS